MSMPLVIALVCAVIALVYGLVSIQWVLAKPAGASSARSNSF